MSLGVVERGLVKFYTYAVLGLTFAGPLSAEGSDGAFEEM